MNNLLELGIKNKIFKIEDGRIIFFIKKQKNYKFDDSTPEEKVRA
jgi:hypothetical protein